MKHALGPDNSLYAEDDAPADLVLGAPALLGIFFAVAVVCAVCFGFGYSARGSAPKAAQASAPTTTRTPRPLGPSPSQAKRDTTGTIEDTDSPGELSSLPPEPDHTGGVPIAATRPKPAPAVRFVPPLTPGQSGAAQEASTILPAPVPGAKSYPGVAAPLAPPSVAHMPAPIEPAPFEGMMVQIAAVSRAADAQTLAAALRHDGFAAIVRTSDGDQFFHVQVGPFATREAANAMRAKLSGNGYNAFVRR